jgi:hypothetical protein
MRHLTLVVAIVSLLLLTLGCGDESKVASKPLPKNDSSSNGGGMGGDPGGGMGDPGAGMGAGMGGGMGGEGMGGEGMGGGMGGEGMGGGMGGEGMGGEGMGGEGMGGEGMGDEGMGDEGMGAEMMAGMLDGDGEGDGDEGMGAEMMAGMLDGDGDGEGGEACAEAGFPGGGPGGGAGFPGGGDGGQAASRTPLTMAEIGKSYLSQGRFKDGMKYIHAAVILGNEEGVELMEQYRWVNGLKQPVLAVRWGIAIQLFQPPDFKGKYFPIGEDQALDGSLANRGQNNNNSGFGGGAGFAGGDAGGLGGDDDGGFPGGDGLGGSGGGSGGFPELIKVAGDLGDFVVRRIKARTERKYYGELLSSTATGGRRQGGGGAGFDGGDPGGGAGFDGGDPGGGAGFPGGDPGGGAGFPGGDPGGGAGFPGGRGGGRSAGSGSASLTMLGKGELKELVHKAKTEGLDVVLYFKIRVVKSTRTGLVTNITEIKVIDVATEKEVFSLSPLKNTEMQKRRDAATKNGEDDDPLEVEIDKLFQFADRQYRMLPVPQKTTDEILELRIKPLVLSDQKPQNPLSALAEIRFLYSKQMVKKEHLPIAFKELLGAELWKKWSEADDAKERAEILAVWLPKAGNGRGAEPAFR